MEQLSHAVCEIRRYPGKCLTHKHSFGQLLFALEGRMMIDTGPQFLELEEDQCYYLPPHCVHTFEAKDRHQFLVVDVPLRFLQSNHQQVQADHHGRLISLDERLRSLRFLLLDESGRGASSSGPLDDLVHYLSKAILTQPKYRSIEYIHAHFNEPITIEQLAAVEHYHPAYYQQWFKKITGKNPSEYIRELRLNEAERLLRETAWSVTDIACHVGYSHPA